MGWDEGDGKDIAATPPDYLLMALSAGGVVGPAASPRVWSGTISQENKRDALVFPPDVSASSGLSPD